MDEEEVEEKFLEELRVDENTSDPSAILDELCNKFKVVMLSARLVCSITDGRNVLPLGISPKNSSLHKLSLFILY